jgi:tetratricopeptide (TPR) repeat protein
LIILEAYRLLSVMRAPLPGPSLERVCNELLVLLAGIFVADIFGRGRRGIWENALLNFAAVFVLLELGLAALWYQRWAAMAGSAGSLPPFEYRLTGTFLGHPNVLSGFLNLLLPILLVRLFSAVNRRQRLAYALSFLPLLLVEYLASSRTGWLAGATGLTTTAAIVLGPPIRTRVQSAIRARNSRRWLVPYVAGATIVVLAGLALGWLVLARARNAPGHASSRQSIWGPAWNTLLEAPVLGRGPGAFPALFDRSAGQTLGFATSHAHNALLQVGLEGGLVGLGLVAAAGWAVVRAFRRSWAVADPGERSRLAAYVGVGAAIAVHHTLDYLFETPLYALAVLGTLMVMAPSQDSTASSGGRRAPAILLGALASLVVVLIGLSRGSVRYWNGLQQAGAGDWESAAQEICAAAETNPAWTLYAFQCALAEAHSPNGDLEEAKRILRETLEVDPYWPTHYANVAALEWTAGGAERGLSTMRQAFQADPVNPVFPLNLGWMEEQLGDVEAARLDYEAALKADPFLMRRVFFSSTPLRRAVAGAAVSTDLGGPAGAELLGWLALDRQGWEEARLHFREALAQDPRRSLSYAGLAVALDAMGDSQASSSAIGTALFLDSGSPWVLHAASQLASRSGRTAEASLLLEKAFHQARDTSTSWLYYARAYFRFFLPGDLVPQMQTAMLTPEFAEDLAELEHDYELLGREADAAEIRDFIARETR